MTKKKNKMYQVEIFTPNKFIVVKGKPVRTPTKFQIPESDLDTIKLSITSLAIEGFRIEEYDPAKKVVETIQIDEDKKKKKDEINKNKEVVVEEIGDSSTIEKLLND